MHWIYILKCEDDHYYVGETTKLYKRFWQHLSGIGGVNTSTYKPEEVVAIYKLNTITKFLDYNKNVLDVINDNYHEYNKWLLINFNNETEYCDNLFSENNIVECMMNHNKTNWEKIRGGKYTRFDVCYKYPENDYIKELPICKCGLPCDIRKNEEQKFIYFRCAKKNMWDEFKEMFDVQEEPCNFFMEYVTDIEFRVNENNNEKKFNDRKIIFKELFKKSEWLKNISIGDDFDPDECVGICNTGYHYTKIKYFGNEINLCYDCFINKNNELSIKYSFDNKCLLKIKK